MCFCDVVHWGMMCCDFSPSRCDRGRLVNPVSGRLRRGIASLRPSTTELAVVTSAASDDLCQHIRQCQLCQLLTRNKPQMAWMHADNYSLEKSTTCDVDHRLQAASKFLNANRWILCDTGLLLQRGWNTLTVSYRRLLVTQQDMEVFTKTILHRFDVLQRRFLRSVVEPSRNIDWTVPWHEILHQWNGRIQSFMGWAKCKPCSEMCFRHHWNLAHYIPLFCIATRPPVAQTGFALEPFVAQTQRLPKLGINMLIERYAARMEGIHCSALSTQCAHFSLTASVSCTTL